jgi:hypothetical protein
LIIKEAAREVVQETLKLKTSDFAAGLSDERPEDGQQRIILSYSSLSGSFYCQQDLSVLACYVSFLNKIFLGPSVLCLENYSGSCLQLLPDAIFFRS